jgi:hypothetical protein
MLISTSWGIVSARRSCQKALKAFRGRRICSSPAALRATGGRSRSGATAVRAAGIDIAYLAEGETCCGLIPGNDGNTAALEARRRGT